MKRILGMVLLLVGLGALLYPHVNGWLVCQTQAREVAVFEERTAHEAQSTEGERDAQEQARETLRVQMEQYNERIFDEGQSGLCDAWSYTVNGFAEENGAVSALAEGEIAVLDIPAMELSIPVRIGANKENMAQGATVLYQTSMPIGGENTNCVISAHRGYRGIPMFREIERLKVGDAVSVRNLWETLQYEVVGIAVIAPDDVDAVKIQAGADMLTLITCHPYTKNYQRYVVYCQRVAQETTAPAVAVTIPAGEEYQSSVPELEREDRINKVTIFLGIVGVVFVLIRIVIRWKHA